jgi:pyruvate kinase
MIIKKKLKEAIKMGVDAIVTVPPYADFIDEVLHHRIVSGIRLNTVMPTKDSLEELLKRLDDKSRIAGKDLWVDLKCRQLRIKNYGVPPFTEIELSHEISVNTPVKAYFSNGTEYATVVEVNKNRLIMLDGPKRVVGPGEAVNICDASLKIDGYFTETDLKYVEAGLKTGVNHYMLSFVEGKSDIEAFKKMYPETYVVAKVESGKGMDYVRNEWNNEARLMAARGDLYIEMKMPHQIIESVETIVGKDKSAIAASRIFGSFAESLEPSCEDIGDVDNLMRMGYKTLMLGDDVCMRRDSVISALNLLNAMSERYR